MKPARDAGSPGAIARRGRFSRLIIFFWLTMAMVLSAVTLPGCAGNDAPQATHLEVLVTDHIGAKIGGEIYECSTQGHCAVLNI